MLVILRSSTACNLQCRYCSADCGDTARKDITLDDCRLLAEQLPEILSEGESVSYLWHGGEPTILAPEQFDSMQILLNKVEQCGHPVNCLMQTNGYCLDDKWLEMLKKHSVGVGLSLDGPETLHDAARVTAGGNKTYTKIITNLNAMLRCDISVSLLCTVRNEHLGQIHGIIDWLFDLDLPIRFNPLLELGRSSESVQPADYYLFLRTVFKMAVERGFAHGIEPLAWMLTSVITGKLPTECSCSGHCGNSIFSVGPGAEIGFCNRDDQNLGNLYTTSLAELRKKSPLWMQRRERQSRLAENCGKCEIWDFCHGGCPDAEGEVPSVDHCQARRNFWQWLREEGLDLFQKSLLERRKVLKEHMGMIEKTRAGLMQAMNLIAPN